MTRAAANSAEPVIVTPDRRLRVFISGADDLSDERAAAERAVRTLRLAPVVYDAAARAHPARQVYRSYIRQSDIFIGIYGGSYGVVTAGMDVSDVEDEYRSAVDMPRLIYVKDVPQRDPALAALISDIADGAGVSYRHFRAADELVELIADDLAVLLTERFAERETDADAAGSIAPHPPRLPATPTSFVDRVEELQQVVQLLRDPNVRLVTIHGAGGVGKTRLALEAGRRLADDFPDGAVVLWLDALTEPGLILQALGAELRVKETAGRRLMDAISDHLRGVRMLILLDNFEHVIAAAPQLADLIALPTASKILVTSRELLHVRGERAVQIEALGVPDESAALRPALDHSDAVQLFVDRAHAVSPEFALTDDNAGDVAAIVRRLEGLPLAVELAAARVRILPPAALLQRLDRTLDLPAVGGPDLPARQRTLRSAIEWSYRLLDDVDQRALERLAVFPGGATLEAADDVLRDLPVDDPVDTIDSLLRKSLLRRSDASDGQPRFSMLAAIREFAAEQLAQRGDGRAVRDRFAAHVAVFAADTARRLHSAEQAACLAGFDAEIKNVQAALEWLHASDRIDDALVLTTHLRWYWVLRGHLTAADGWMRRLLAQPVADPAIRGQGLTTAAMVAYELGDTARSRDLFQQAVAALEQAGDRDGLAWARTGLGAVLASLGERSQAEQLQTEALETFRSEDDLLGQCTANTRIAVLSLVDGDYATAEQRFNASLDVRRQIRDQWGTSYVLTELGSVRLLADDHEQARRYLEEALTLVRQIEHRDGIARALVLLACVDAGEGEWAAAGEKLDEALRLYDSVGNRSGWAQALALSARVEAEQGEMRAAAEHAAAAFAYAAEAVHARAATAALDALVCVLVDRGDAENAAVLLGAARRIRAAHGVPGPQRDPMGPGRFESVLEDALDPPMLAGAVERGAQLADADLRALVATAAGA